MIKLNDHYLNNQSLSTILLLFEGNNFILKNQ
jgi:hypothetical protein